MRIWDVVTVNKDLQSHQKSPSLQKTKELASEATEPVEPASQPITLVAAVRSTCRGAAAVVPQRLLAGSASAVPDPMAPCRIYYATARRRAATWPRRRRSMWSHRRCSILRRGREKCGVG